MARGPATVAHGPSRPFRSRAAGTTGTEWIQSWRRGDDRRPARSGGSRMGDPPVLRSLAEACLARESAAFDRSLGDWPDRRRDGRVPGPGWCNGAAGIALSRALVNDVGRDLDRASHGWVTMSCPATRCAAERQGGLKFCGSCGTGGWWPSSYDHAVGVGSAGGTAGTAARCSSRLPPTAARTVPGDQRVMLALAGSVNAATPHVLALGTT